MISFNGHQQRSGTIAFTIMLIFASLAFGQNPDIRPLPPNQTIEREMSAKETHHYSIRLKTDEFFQVWVEQKGVDVALKLLDAQGNVLAAMDSPNGNEGPETISYVASNDGRYRLKISESYEKSKGGYTIKRGTSRTATAKDKRRVEVEKLFAEGITAANTEGQEETAIKKLEIAERGWRELEDVYLADLTAFQLKVLNVEKKRNSAAKYQDNGNYEKAIKIYNEVLPFYQEIHNQDWVASIYGTLGIAYDKNGNDGKAIESLKNALVIYEDIQIQGGQMIINKRLGLVYKGLGDKGREQALKHYQKALQLSIELNDKKYQADILNSLGKLQPYDERALIYFNQSLDLYRETKNENGEAVVLGNMAYIYSQIYEFENMIKSLKRSTAIYRKNKDYSGEASNLLRGALVLMSEPKFLNEAIQFAHDALRLCEFSNDIDQKPVALYLLMDLYKRAENSEAAILYGKQLINAYQDKRFQIKNLNKELQGSFLTSVEESYRILADLLISDGRFAQAEQVLAMLKDEEYSSFVRRDADEIKNLNQRVVLTDKEKKLHIRYIALANRITEIGQQFIKLDDKKRTLSRNNLNLAAEEQKRYEKLEKQLDTANAAFQLFLNKQLIPELGIKKTREIEYDRNLQAKLRKWGEGTVALYTVVGEDRYRVILTTPKVQVDGKTEIKIADLNKRVFAFRKALHNPNVDPRPLGKELYDILIKPIEKELKAAGAKTLIWSLDGALRYIPLAALSPDGKRYLVEDFQNVIITPKTRDDVSNSDSNWQALGLGVSTAQTVESPDNEFERIPFKGLPGVERELKSIVRDETIENETGVLIGRRFLNADFTGEVLKDSLAKETKEGKRKYNVVHIASHFRLGSNWSNSFLLLGSGRILTLEDINNSSTIDFGDVELVTLSACNTGFGDSGDGKEIDSLASVIQTKSGKAVMATLWAVADESTAIFMSEFYRLRRENPALTKALALQQAQQKLIKGGYKTMEQAARYRTDRIPLGGEKTNQPKFKTDPKAKYAHPYYWSPFVLIGNWR